MCADCEKQKEVLHGLAAKILAANPMRIVLSMAGVKQNTALTNYSQLNHRLPPRTEPTNDS